MGRGAGLLTLAGDVAKGALPQLVCLQLNLDISVASYAGAASVFGHLFPVFGAFRGGKGVATAFGVLLVLAPSASIASVAVFAVGANSTRFVSVGSMLAAATLPMSLYAFDSPWEVIRMGMLIAAAILWRHRENLFRLMRNTEPRF